MIVLNALAGSLFAYSCFLWTRSVCMVRRRTLPPMSPERIRDRVFVPYGSNAPGSVARSPRVGTGLPTGHDLIAERERGT